jgi:hypothetical protein
MQDVQQSTSQLVGAAVRGAMGEASSSSGSSLLTLAIGVACRTSTDVLCKHLLMAKDASADTGQPDLLDRLLQFAGATSCLGVCKSTLHRQFAHSRALYLI